MKHNFYRLDYASERILADLQQNDPVRNIPLGLHIKLTHGAHILAARFNAESKIGRVRLIGRVEQSGSKMNISWRAADFELHPTQQGQRHWAKPFFRFADNVAVRYQLEALCREAFQN